MFCMWYNKQECGTHNFASKVIALYFTNIKDEIKVIIVLFSNVKYSPTLQQQQQQLLHEYFSKIYVIV